MNQGWFERSHTKRKIAGEKDQGIHQLDPIQGGWKWPEKTPQEISTRLYWCSFCKSDASLNVSRGDMYISHFWMLWVLMFKMGGRGGHSCSTSTINPIFPRVLPHKMKRREKTHRYMRGLCEKWGMGGKIFMCKGGLWEDVWSNVTCQYKLSLDLSRKAESWLHVMCHVNYYSKLYYLPFFPQLHNS